MTSARLLTSQDIVRWKNLPIETHSFFQKYSWNRLLSDVYSYEDYTLVIEDRSGSYAFLPLKLVKSQFLGNRLISTPFSDYAGPTDSGLENQMLLIAAASELYRRLEVDFLEVRLDRNHSLELYPELERRGFKRIRRYSSFLVDLKGGEKETWERITSSTRRAIAKSERGGVEVSVAKRRGDIQSYHQLHLASSREHGAPAHPLRFFTELYGNLYPEGQMKLLIARQHDQEVAGLLLLRHESTVHYWQSSLPSQYRTLNPFHLLLWKALSNSIEEGYKSFDLGRTRRQTGVYRFKQTWGGVEYLLDHYCLYRGKPPTIADPEDLRYKAASLLWRRIPQAVQAKVGPRLIREIAL